MSENADGAAGPEPGTGGKGQDATGAAPDQSARIAELEGQLKKEQERASRAFSTRDDALRRQHRAGAILTHHLGEEFDLDGELQFAVGDVKVEDGKAVGTVSYRPAPQSGASTNGSGGSGKSAGSVDKPKTDQEPDDPMLKRREGFELSK